MLYLSFDYALNDLQRVSNQIITHLTADKIVLFYGDIGAGKTTLIKQLCHDLGVKETATSPTFSIINEYAVNQAKIYHFDFYRLKNQTEALDMGYEEYFYSGNYCFVEWPEKIPDLIPASCVKINLTVTGEQTRRITIEQL